MLYSCIPGLELKDKGDNFYNYTTTITTKLTAFFSSYEVCYSTMILKYAIPGVNINFLICSYFLQNALTKDSKLVLYFYLSKYFFN